MGVNKLTLENIEEIKKLRKLDPPYGWKRIAKIYGIDPTTAMFHCRDKKTGQILKEYSPIEFSKTKFSHRNVRICKDIISKEKLNKGHDYEWYLEQHKKQQTVDKLLRENRAKEYDSKVKRTLTKQILL